MIDTKHLRKVADEVQKNFCVPYAQDIDDAADELEQLRGTLSLAEEGLANYAQEMEQLKAAQSHMYGEGKRFEGLWRDAAQQNERLRAEFHAIRNQSLVWSIECPCICPECNRLYKVIRDAEPQEAKHE